MKASLPHASRSAKGVIRAEARLADVPTVLAQVVACARRAGVAPEAMQRIELSVEEVLVNVCSYAYPPGRPGQVTVTCEEHDGRFQVEIKDHGNPCNPLEIPGPDTAAALEDREIGGLGVFLVRQLTREVHYSRTHRANVLTLVYRPPTTLSKLADDTPGTGEPRRDESSSASRPPG